jgi:rhamnulokinase
MTTTHLAIDLGAESGRAMLGHLRDGRLTLQEIHRFPNEPLKLATGLHWDLSRLFDEILASLRLATAACPELHSVAIDAWGVDYGLVDQDGILVGPPFHYRDNRVDGMLALTQSRVSASDLYGETGCQTIQFNTLYQLLADAGSGRLERAERLLMVPDLLAYWLTGEMGTERTIASTTQLYNPVTRDWAWNVIGAVGLPTRLFGEIAAPGSVRGALKREHAAATGVHPGLAVIAVGSHDTASAFAAASAGETGVVISSGTWSLAGIETPGPIITPAAMAANFTNEAGVCDTNRFLRNIAGMWPIQECRRAWAEAGSALGYAELTALAEAAPTGGPMIDLDDPRLVAPGNMPERIRQLCLESGQPPPANQGEMVRCLLESLALNYRLLVDDLHGATGRPIDSIQIIGGGSRNQLHCQLAAEATGLPVTAGPVEATAIGNVMTQALALGEVASLAEIREIVGRSQRIDRQ